MTAARLPRPFTAVVLALLVGSPSFVRADAEKATWEPARTTSPTSLAELRALEAQIKVVVDKTMPSTVAILIPGGAGSGVIVSEDGLVLTAAHVIGKPGRTVMFMLSDGTLVRGKSLGVSRKNDSGMAKITDKPPTDATWPGAKDGKWLAAEMNLKAGQWLVALGHHGGPQKDRTPPLRVGRYDKTLDPNREEGLRLRTDCTLVGGDSGGPLFDLTGKVVGIHSKISYTLSANMHVPIDTYRTEWDKLAKGENIGRAPVEIGLTLDDEAEEAKVKAVKADGPADKAGVKVGDVIVRVDREKVQSADDFEQQHHGFDPRQTVTLTVVREDMTLTLKLTTGTRPGK
jgi:serine protease Do